MNNRESQNHQNFSDLVFSVLSCLQPQFMQTLHNHSVQSKTLHSKHMDAEYKTLHRALNCEPFAYSVLFVVTHCILFTKLSVMSTV